jgi:hypothetical protein
VKVCPDDSRVEEDLPTQLEAAGAIYQKIKTCVLCHPQDGKLVSWVGFESGDGGVGYETERVLKQQDAAVGEVQAQPG